LVVHPAARLSLRLRVLVFFEKYHLRVRRGLSYWIGP
jgi:hypothetical protein